MTDRQKLQLARQGFVLLESVISRQKAEQIRQISIQLANLEITNGTAQFYLGQSQRVWNLVNKHPIFAEIIQHPQILSSMEYLLGDDCILSSFTVNRIAPGSKDGGLHIDFPLSTLPTPRPSFPLVANSIWFLDDFTITNGATRCIPSSHHRLIEKPCPDSDYLDSVQILGKKGSVLIINGAVWHGSAANYTNQDRIGLLGFFCRSMMKPQQDLLNLATESTLRSATPTLKRLLGFDSIPSRFN